jgi:BirA family transcriptional regulator, biotin operon repressor / biotin---[acetyl-CoA-carboxylase] ligase
MVPQEISVVSIKKRLNTRLIGRNMLYFPRLSSTMDEARRQVQKKAPEGTVVIAGEQTRGRGRLKRQWFAPAGNIALSLVLYPEVTGMPYLIMIASLAAAQSIESVTGLQAQIKWPNDVLIDRKKVVGILVETEVKGNNITAIIGVGINVALQPEEIDEISLIATSLEEQLGEKVSREEVIQKFLEEFEKLYIKLSDGQSIFNLWLRRLVTLGQNVAAHWGKEIIEGIAESVDETGALLIRRNDGTLTRIVAGDVTLKK